MSELTINAPVHIKKDVSNVFDALELPNGPIEWLKVSLTKRINLALSLIGDTQTARAAILGVAQPVVSNLERYELAGFSVDRLMRYAILLGITDLGPERIPSGGDNEY